MPKDEAFPGELDACCACEFWYYKGDCGCLSRLASHRFCDRHRRDLFEGIDRLERVTVMLAERRRMVAAAGTN